MSLAFRLLALLARHFLELVLVQKAFGLTHDESLGSRERLGFPGGEFRQTLRSIDSEPVARTGYALQVNEMGCLGGWRRVASNLGE